MSDSTDKSTIYSDAFNYDQIHSGGRGNADFDFFKKMSQNKKAVLEVACGTGRITIPLAQAGVPISGLDNSPAMLAEAKKKADKSLKINWIEADCTDFELNRKFDFIFMTANSLQHLHSHEQVFKFFDCIKSHLTPEGVFVFDIFLPSLKILSRDPSNTYPVAKYINIDGLQISLNEKNFYDPLTQVNTIKWYHSGPSGETIKEDTLEMRQFFPQELALLLEVAGFKIEQRFGSWELSKPKPDDFQQIFVLRLK